MDSDPLYVTREQVKAALTAMGIPDPPRPGRPDSPDKLNFISLTIAAGKVTIERLRYRPDGGIVVLPGAEAATERVTMRIGNPPEVSA